MASIYKREIGTLPNGKPKYSSIWRFDYTDENGRRRTLAGYKDKRATEDLAKQYEKNVARIRAGLPPEPLTDKLRDPHQSRQLQELVPQYLKHLVAAGTPMQSIHYRE